MLIEKGTHIRVKLAGKKERGLRGAMMHDPDGEYWPECSLLIGSFSKYERPADEDEYQGAPKYYLGRTVSPYVGSVDLPPRALSEWDNLGDVEIFYYVRPGSKAPGEYNHHMNKPRGMMHLVFMVKGRGRAILRKCDGFYRLDFPDGCILDDRGIAWP